jgi:hypothetical protein
MGALSLSRNAESPAFQLLITDILAPWLPLLRQTMTLPFVYDDAQLTLVLE